MPVSPRARAAARRAGIVRGRSRRHGHVDPDRRNGPALGRGVVRRAHGEGADAFFKYTNARKGVFKRKINYDYKDDAYDPAKTIQATRELVQQDRVFAIFNPLGTAHNIATRPYLNSVGVPQVFVASGWGGWAADARRYP